MSKYSLQNVKANDNAKHFSGTRAFPYKGEHTFQYIPTCQTGLLDLLYNLYNDKQFKEGVIWQARWGDSIDDFDVVFGLLDGVYRLELYSNSRNIESCLKAQSDLRPLAIAYELFITNILNL